VLDEDKKLPLERKVIMLRIAGISKPKRSVSFLSVTSLTLLIFCVGCYGQFEKSMQAEDVFAQTSTDDFYAYYTRLDYKIPVEQALDYIPMEDEEEYEGDREEEIETIAFEDLPESVRKATRKEYPHQSLMGVEVEREEGGVHYIVMFEVDGTEAGLLLNATGRILERWHDSEEEEDSEELWKDVSRAICLSGKRKKANGSLRTSLIDRMISPVCILSFG
jgi:hypothetical protein